MLGRVTGNEWTTMCIVANEGDAGKLGFPTTDVATTYDILTCCV